MIERLWWGVRRYAMVLVIVGLVVADLALVALSLGNAVPAYRAEALVIASELGIRPDQLPDTAETIFRSGDVAAAAVEAGNLPFTPEELIPDHVTVEPVEASVVMLVVGSDPDPRLAADLANATASAFASELNEAGPGLGSFAVQAPATVPTEPELASPRAVRLALAAMAGLVAVAGLLLALLALRKPLVSGPAAAAATGGPLLGTVSLPKGDTVPEPEHCVGLSRLEQELFPNGEEGWALVSTPADAATRSRLVGALAQLAGRHVPVRLVDLSPDRRLQSLETLEGVSYQHRLAATTRSAVNVVNGPDTRGVDLPQLLPPGMRAALVVRDGTPEALVRSIAEQFPEGLLGGVVFVELTRRRAGTAPRLMPVLEEPARTVSGSS